jgi:hypothetical protein
MRGILARIRDYVHVLAMVFHRKKAQPVRAPKPVAPNKFYTPTDETINGLPVHIYNGWPKHRFVKTERNLFVPVYRGMQ